MKLGRAGGESRDRGRVGHAEPPRASPRLTWGAPGVGTGPSAHSQRRRVPRRQGWLLAGEPRRWAGRGSDALRWQRDLPQLVGQGGVRDWAGRPRQLGVAVSGCCEGRGRGGRASGLSDTPLPTPHGTGRRPSRNSPEALNPNHGAEGARPLPEDRAPSAQTPGPLQSCRCWARGCHRGGSRESGTVTGLGLSAHSPATRERHEGHQAGLEPCRSPWPGLQVAPVGGGTRADGAGASPSRASRPPPLLPPGTGPLRDSAACRGSRQSRTRGQARLARGGAHLKCFVLCC